MIKPAFTRFLNHLISQNTWARVHLRPFAGKAVCLAMPPLEANLSILEDGGLAVAGEVAVADARILIPFSAALRLFAGDDAAGRQVKMEGETELAMVLAKVLQNMTWEYEEDLSQIVGDVAASKIAEFGRKAIEEVKSQSVNMAEMLAEYWQEEKPLLAKKRHVEQFVKEVDVLRDDVERLAKRIEKFERKLAATRQE